MNITVKNIGPLREASFEIGDLTIFCGDNNTGKTYATYALYGFLEYWNERVLFTIERKVIDDLLDNGAVEIPLSDFLSIAPHMLADSCKDYSKNIAEVFASSEKNFTQSHFSIEIDPAAIIPVASYHKTIGAVKQELFSIKKDKDSDTVTVTLLTDSGKMKIHPKNLQYTIGRAFVEIIFGTVIPNPFIASAERTGAAIFRKELNFSRNRLLEQLGAEKDTNPFGLLKKISLDYPLPVKSNVEFTRSLEELSKQDSFLVQEHPDILGQFRDIIGGEYSVNQNDELFYIPSLSSKIKLRMDESSSAVRALLDVGFYLNHVARKGDLLMIDEPELNLHPSNQRKIARLFTQLANIGIKVFITTHSDYIIKEINTLIMLNQKTTHSNAVANEFCYLEREFISSDKLRVYIAEKAQICPDGQKRRGQYQTLTEADIDPIEGIEARSFDETINDMNRIQDALIWGEE